MACRFVLQTYSANRTARGRPTALISTCARTDSAAVSGLTGMPYEASHIRGTLVSIIVGAGSNAICSSDCNAKKGVSAAGEARGTEARCVGISNIHITMLTLAAKPKPGASHRELCAKTCCQAEVGRRGLEAGDSFGVACALIDAAVYCANDLIKALSTSGGGYSDATVLRK